MSTTVKPGDRFDEFGKVWDVVKVRSRVVDARAGTVDAFGKLSHERRAFHISAFEVMRKMGPTISQK